MLLVTEKPADTTNVDMLVDVQNTTEGRPVNNLDYHACCSECHNVLVKYEFQNRQWTRTDGQHFCWNCVKKHEDEGMHMQCNRCRTWKSKSAFTREERHNSRLTTRVCDVCREEYAGVRKRCSVCGSFLPPPSVLPEECNACNSSPMQRRCLRCLAKVFVHRWCSQCQQYLPRTSFTSERMWARSNNTLRRCSKCLVKQKGMRWCPRCNARKPTKHFRIIQDNDNSAVRRGMSRYCDNSRVSGACRSCCTPR